ncbi:MAG: GTP cyclohydrolase II [Candidatus Thalassarchaeaceae archaeon]|jgi:GTP cyclohydrolase II|nr:GTP cyclohydrolase II [Candidatus Thalassarchaeaceae archaeon]MDP7042542.1 GTP cyclohydrolase II [Candidatus Thalassarchaeaceae archaeon]
MLTLDLLGYHCPVPVHETRKALEGMVDGAILEVIADDPETKHDIPMMVERFGAKLVSLNEDVGEIRFIIEKQRGSVEMDNSAQIKVREAKDIPADARLPTTNGEFRIRVFHEENTGLDHVALSMGDLSGPDPVLVRIHSECLTGDAFGSLRCDCGHQLSSAMSLIEEKGWGCIIYLRQEGRGIGLREKIKAYNLQDEGADTMDANIILGHPPDARNYRIATEIIKALEISEVSLLTNNPDKVEQMKNMGVNIVEIMPIIVGVGKENIEYLTTKAERMGHAIDSNALNGD